MSTRKHAETIPHPALDEAALVMLTELYQTGFVQGAIAHAIIAAEKRGRQLLEARIVDIVMTSKLLKLSRGTCESMLDELADETDDEWRRGDLAEQRRELEKAETRGREAERADVIALHRSSAERARLLASQKTGLERLVLIGIDSAVQASIETIERGEHVGAADKKAGA